MAIIQTVQAYIYKTLRVVALGVLVSGIWTVAFDTNTQVHAAEACKGSTAPAGYDCSAIPIGCPGTTAAGPTAGQNLDCPFKPTSKTYKCPVKTCTYTAPSTNNKEGTAMDGSCETLDACDLVSRYINPFIRLLSVSVGVVVVASIIIGGIQYGSSANDPGKVTAAKNRIRNALLALLAYIFLFSLLNFLVPGGVI